MELQELLDPKKTAVIVLGLQNDYCDPGGRLPKIRNFDVTPIQEMVKVLEGFLDSARAGGVPVIWIRYIEDRAYVPKNFRLKMDSIQGSLDLASPDSWGGQFYHFAPGKGEEIFKVNQFDALSNEELVKHLKKSGIETLIIVGVYTSRGIDTSVRSAASKGFNVFVPLDLVAMPKQLEGEHYAALTIMNTLFAYVVESAFITGTWSGKSGKPGRASMLKKFMGIR